MPAWSGTKPAWSTQIGSAPPPWRDVSAVRSSGPGDLANGEREAVRHSHGIGEVGYQVRLGSCTHTPYLTHHSRRSTVDSPPRRGTRDSRLAVDGAQAMNKMVIQDERQVFR